MYFLIFFIALISLTNCSTEKSDSAEKGKDLNDLQTEKNDKNTNPDNTQKIENNTQSQSKKTATTNPETINAVETCTPPPNIKLNPETIQEFVTLLNALPKPTSVICVMQVLKRPLLVNATSNKFSAQPAASYQSPRIFIKNGNLIISVVPAGKTSYSIELAQNIDSAMSIKGDIQFPVMNALSPTDAFKNIYSKGSPSCAGLCHTNSKIIKKWNEEVTEYASTIIFPRTADNVPLVDLEMFRDACNDEVEASKKICRFYKAMFDHGDVEWFDYKNL